jgi:hypothetical protein
MQFHRLGPDGDVSYRLAQQQVANDFEGSYVLDLVGRHAMDLRAAAREAKMPLKELRALLLKHTRTWFVARVRAFYGDKLDLATVKQVAEHLQSLELATAAG